MNQNEKEMQKAYEIGYNQARKEILEFIEHERDEGNVLNMENKLNVFSPSLCLSDLIKLLKKKE